MVRSARDVGAVLVVALDRSVKISTGDRVLFTIVPEGFQAMVCVGHAGRVWVERCDDQRQARIDAYVLQVVVRLLPVRDAYGLSDLELVKAFRGGFANVLADAEAKADQDIGKLN